MVTVHPQTRLSNPQIGTDERRKCGLGLSLWPFFTQEEETDPETSQTPLVEEDSSSGRGVKNVRDLSAMTGEGKEESHRYLQLNSRGNIEEIWEFEPDAYSLGLCSLVQRGLQNAWCDILIAMLPVIFQLIAFFSLMMTSLADREEVKENHFAGTVEVCIMLCLALMSSHIVREAIEGFKMITFACRGMLLTYDLPHSPGALAFGCVFGFFQMNMTIGSFALTCAVLIQAQTVLDVFMNFLAISFLTEIPSTIMENILLKPRLNCVEFTFSVEHRNGMGKGPSANLDQVSASPVPIFLLAIASLLTFSCCCMIFLVNYYGCPDPEIPVDWGSSFALAIAWILACDVTVWFGSRIVGAWRITLFNTLVCACIMWANVMYRYVHDGAWLLGMNPVVNMVFFVQPIIWLPVMIAAEPDALTYLLCPYSLPLMFYLPVVNTPIWMYQLLTYGSS